MLPLLSLILTFLFIQSINGQDYSEIANKIITESKKISLDRFTYLCDTFGPRWPGTENLQQAIDYVNEQMINDGFSVVLEPVYNITHWIRGFKLIN